MDTPLLNSTGRCRGCNGIVHNISGKRHSRERLEDIHRDTCPGVRRRK